MVTNRLTGQNGMSLIEMLIVTGILSFISLVIASTFGDIFKLQSQVVARDETNEIAASIGRYMMSESTCTAALGGQLFPVAAGATTKIQLPDYMGVGASANGVDIKDGSYISPKIRVHELSLRNKGMAPHDTLSESKIYKRYVGQITLKLEANLDSKWVPSSPRNFELPLLVDPLNSRINR